MVFFFFQAEDGIRDVAVTGVQTCALPILLSATAVAAEPEVLGLVAAPLSVVSAAPATDFAACASNKSDRKSTRLNSSHGYISYAVFCLKKKKNTHRSQPARLACSRELPCT